MTQRGSTFHRSTRGKLSRLIYRYPTDLFKHVRCQRTKIFGRRVNQKHTAFLSRRYFLPSTSLVCLILETSSVFNVCQTSVALNDKKDRFEEAAKRNRRSKVHTLDISLIQSFLYLHDPGRKKEENLIVYLSRKSRWKQNSYPTNSSFANKVLSTVSTEKRDAARVSRSLVPWDASINLKASVFGVRAVISWLFAISSRHLPASCLLSANVQG